MDSKQPGEAWIREILDSNETHCMINFRMSKIIFTSLLRVLETRYKLQTSRHISSREMLGIFLYILETDRCKSFPMSRNISKVQLMVLILPLFFNQMNKFHTLEENVSRLRMLW
ncbi:hypothetical protein Gohar_008708 [Gossypium harknessii]|uniref:DUF8040 domain-containing protein n=1 Tax=Gossypium harknessii TaxID=34285 RepID=A0A7J9GKI7_9ROSI|nr:hypothetical protein [Gossypium harknessii]